jgi:hypothetical protein
MASRVRGRDTMQEAGGEVLDDERTRTRDSFSVRLICDPSLWTWTNILAQRR